jgi:four helix bundle protein
LSKTIQNFTDLKAWQAAHTLRINVLRTIQGFPAEYQFGLAAQLQRCAISVGSNIAEGFGRKSTKDRVHFYVIAKASLIEVQDQLIVSKDMGLINNKKFLELADQSIKAHKLLNGLIRATKNLDSRS